MDVAGYYGNTDWYKRVTDATAPFVFMIENKV